MNEREVTKIGTQQKTKTKTPTTTARLGQNVTEYKK